MSFRFSMIKTIPNKPQIVRNIVGPKGPVTSGLVKAQELNAEFYQLANEKMKKGFMTIEEMKYVLSKNFIQKNFKLDVRPVNMWTSQTLGYFHRFKNNLYLGVKASKDGATSHHKYKIKKYDSEFLMHETFHLFVSLLNPKINARVNSINKPIANFFEKNIYSSISILDKLFNWPKRFENRLNKFLATMPEEKQVNALQFFRYAIINEALAFNESMKYGSKVNINKKCAFEEKYEIIERTLIEKMEKIRKG